MKIIFLETPELQLEAFTDTIKNLRTNEGLVVRFAPTWSEVQFFKVPIKLFARVSYLPKIDPVLNPSL